MRSQSQLSTDTAVYANTVHLVTELARNPIVELILAYALVEKLQDRGVLGSLQGSVMQGGIAGIIAVQQLAPIVPDLLKGAGDIGKVAGLLSAAAAIPGIPP